MKDIPVVMLSARHDESDKLYGFEMGVDDYMTKPFFGQGADGPYQCGDLA